MSQGPLCPNLSQKVQKEVSQMANRNLSCVILLGGLSVNLNHLKTNVVYALTLNIFIPLISLILGVHGMEGHVILTKISKYLLLIWEFATLLIMMHHHSLFEN